MRIYSQILDYPENTFQRQETGILAYLKTDSGGVAVSLSENMHRFLMRVLLYVMI